MAQDDSDTDALLRDLEQRAQKGGTASKTEGGGDEDIEAFLRDLEGGDYVPPPEPAPSKASPSVAKPATKTREADPLEDAFVGLQEAPDAPLTAPVEKEKKVSERARKKEEKRQAQEAKKEEAKKAKAEVQVVERGESAGLKTFLRVAKWSAIVVPIVLAIWLLGAYLSAWVSASWLIAAIATALVLVLPLGVRLLSGRGKYGWWAAGLSALLILALVVPMTASAGRALERYGHWPATVVADVAAWSPDHAVVRATGAIGSFFGQLIQPTPEKDVPRKLGSEEPLSGADPVPPAEPAPVQPAPVQPAPVQPAPTAP